MSPEVFKKSKYLFVVYPVACGGNHLANMLSLCDEVESFSSYEELLSQYKALDDRLMEESIIGIKAHFSDTHLVENLNDTSKESIDKVKLFIGHAQHYFDNDTEKYVKEIDNKVWIVLSFPSENSIPHNRILNSGYNYCLVDKYTWPYMTGSSDNQSIANDGNGFYFDTEEFFTPTGSQYLRELLLNNFGIVLPDTADTLHSIWYEWMEYVSMRH